MKVRVYHQYYGCETGCCGHVVEMDGQRVGRFQFSHPYGKDTRTWARELVEEVIREEQPECLPSIDWDTLDIEEASDFC